LDGAGLALCARKYLSGVSPSFALSLFMVGSLIDVWDGPGLGTGAATHQLHLIPHTISPPSITKQLGAVEVAKTKSLPSASDDSTWGPPWSSGSRATYDGNTHGNSYPPCWRLSPSTQHGQRIHPRTPAHSEVGAHTKHSFGLSISGDPRGASQAATARWCRAPIAQRFACRKLGIELQVLSI
jgi:hypothetical protein